MEKQQQEQRAQMLAEYRASSQNTISSVVAAKMKEVKDRMARDVEEWSNEGREENSDSSPSESNSDTDADEAAMEKEILDSVLGPDWCKSPSSDLEEEEEDEIPDIFEERTQEKEEEEKEKEEESRDMYTLQDLVKNKIITEAEMKSGTFRFGETIIMDTALLNSILAVGWNRTYHEIKVTANFGTDITFSSSESIEEVDKVMHKIHCVITCLKIAKTSAST
jgi:hypothetical protein